MSVNESMCILFSPVKTKQQACAGPHFHAATPGLPTSVLGEREASEKAKRRKSWHVPVVPTGVKFGGKPSSVAGLLKGQQPMCFLLLEGG